MKPHLKLYIAAIVFILFFFLQPGILQQYFPDIPDAVVTVCMLIGLYGGVLCAASGNALKKKFESDHDYKLPKFYHIFPMNVNFFILAISCFLLMPFVGILQEVYDGVISRLLGSLIAIGMVVFLVIGIVKTLHKHKKMSTFRSVKLYIAGGLALASSVLSLLPFSFGGDMPLFRALGVFWLLLCTISGFFLIAFGGVVQKKIQEDPDYRLPKFYRIFPPYGNLFFLSAFFGVSIMMVGAFSGLKILLAAFYFASVGCLLAGLVMWIRSKVKTSDFDVENNRKKIAKHR